ncbi:MAG: maleylacetoacetate isomerase [Byssovorax sp.]
MKLTLHHFWRSSASWRVRWALAIKGLPFDSVPVDLLSGEQKTEAHRAYNPIGHVPALVFDDGRALGESVAILEYLDEVVPDPPLYPRDPWKRARVRQLVETINAGVQPLQNLVVLARISPEREAQQAWASFFIERGLTAYEQLLAVVAAEGPESAAGPFSAGSALTAADLFLVPQMNVARRFKVDVSPFPRCLAVEAAALATPHAASALPENQPGAPKG